MDSREQSKLASGPSKKSKLDPGLKQAPGDSQASVENQQAVEKQKASDGQQAATKEDWNAFGILKARNRDSSPDYDGRLGVDQPAESGEAMDTRFRQDRETKNNPYLGPMDAVSILSDHFRPPRPPGDPAAPQALLLPYCESQAE